MATRYLRKHSGADDGCFLATTAHCRPKLARLKSWEVNKSLKRKVVRKIDFGSREGDGGVRVQVVGTTRALPSLPHCGTAQLMLDAVYEIYAPSPTWHADAMG
jgi:hypothetical protein